jgi:hypothetical protein
MRWVAEEKNLHVPFGKKNREALTCRREKKEIYILMGKTLNVAEGKVHDESRTRA